MIAEHDIVTLKSDRPGDGPRTEHVGTVVHVYPDAAAFEVEFTPLSGQTAAVIPLKPNEVREVGPSEIANARELALS